MQPLLSSAVATLLALVVPVFASAEERLDLSLGSVANGGLELRYGRAEAGRGWELGAGLLPVAVERAVATDEGWLGLLRAGYLLPLVISGGATEQAPPIGLRVSALLLQGLLDDGLRDRTLLQTAAGGEAVVTLRWRPRDDLELSAEAGLLGGYGWGMATSVRHNETGRTEGPFWAPALHLLVGRRW